MLERRELGEAGLAYLRERLAGGRTLSRLLLEELDGTADHTWAYLPPAMTDEQAAHYAEAGITRLSTRAPPERFEQRDGRWEVVHNLVDPLLTVHVLDFLTAEEHGVAVWEDPLTTVGEPWVRDHPEEPLLFLGDEVYYVLQRPAATPAAIADGLEVMDAWWGSPAVLAVLPSEALRPFLLPRVAIDAQELRPLVEHLRLLFFQAYDREGYVCWSSLDLTDRAGSESVLEKLPDDVTSYAPLHEHDISQRPI
jgi:hypothetical protein